VVATATGASAGGVSGWTQVEGLDEVGVFGVSDKIVVLSSAVFPLVIAQLSCRLAQTSGLPG